MAPGRVMIDVAGTTLGTADRARLAHPNAGGVILFARNYVGRTELERLISEIRAMRPGLLIAVDHEGGRVQRFRDDGFTRLPAMARLGELWDSDPVTGAIQAVRAATDIGYVLARELLAVGIDLSFTPVLDLDHGRSRVVGDRALHRDARVVTLLAKSLNHGLTLAGMGNCGKHFPGHGYVEADSHLALPVDSRTLEAILRDDAAPYGWLGPALAAVMPAHITYPQVDSVPAGFSKLWLTEILRKRLGFEGVVFSDDLSMEGARAAGDIVSAAQAALSAGCDMVLVCNAPERAAELLHGLDCASDPKSVARMARLPRAPLPGELDLAVDSVYLEARGRVLALLGP
jgi:beta-N-acetylhexosaminidase